MDRFLGALALVSLLAVSSTVSAGGYGHRHGGHHGYHHRGGGHAGLVVGALIGGAILGHLLTEPYRPRRARYDSVASTYGPPPGLGGCQATTGTGYVNGRPAKFSGTMCFDSAGDGYILNNSTRLLGYLD